MPNVTPSQVVKFIETRLQDCLLTPPKMIELSPHVCGALSTLLRITDQLPNPLLPTDPQLYVQFLESQESIRVGVAMAQNQNSFSRPPILPFVPRGDPVMVIRDVLAVCTDEAPPQQSAELAFIDDSEFRKILLVDLAAVRSALANSEWKAATVLAGALVEALLLWGIQRKNPSDVQAACAAAVTAGELQQKPRPDHLSWDLHEYVVVATQLSLIKPNTAVQARLAKDFRNLIHPGRTIRMGESCDLGTAHAASAAVAFVSRDLEAQSR